MQQIKVLIHLTAPPLPPAVAGAGPFFIHYLGPLEEQVESLLELLDWFIGLVDAEIHETWQDLMREMEQRLEWCYEMAEPK